MKGVSRAIVEEVFKHAEKIDMIDYGKVTFVIQDGRVLRVVVENAWLAGEQPPAEG